jgi:hypothetical protein
MPSGAGSVVRITTMKNRNKSGKGKKIPMDGAPTIQPKEIVTENPWDGFAEDYRNSGSGKMEDGKLDLKPFTFAKTSRNTWINLGSMQAIIESRDCGQVVTRLCEWKERCNLGQVHEANKKKEAQRKAVKKLKLKV